MNWWLLTNTTYGTWLPGDARGSVTSVRDRRLGERHSLSRRKHNRPGEAWEPAIPGLVRSAQKLLKGPPVYLTDLQADTLLAQFMETADRRGWRLSAAAIMENHYHLVIATGDEWAADRVISDFKAYATRALNRAYGTPASGTWWTAKGSKRRLPDERAIAAATHYVLCKQPQPLVVWSRDAGRMV